MFDTLVVIKGLALVIAIGLLLSKVDFSYILAKFSVKKNIVNPPSVVIDQGDAFIKTLELWYALKKQCEESKLTEASIKLDEVFPLLNDNLEGGGKWSEF